MSGGVGAPLLPSTSLGPWAAPEASAAKEERGLRRRGGRTGEDSGEGGDGPCPCRLGAAGRGRVDGARGGEAGRAEAPEALLARDRRSGPSDTRRPHRRPRVREEADGASGVNPKDEALLRREEGATRTS